MKRVVIKRPKQEHKILQDESDKLKNKLEHLKKQIQMKKKQKEGQHPSSDPQGLSKSRKSHLSNIQIETELQEVLEKLNLNRMTSKLKEKGITTIQKLHSILPEEVDGWRDLTVGYRIKLRKYLEKRGHSQEDARKSSISLSPQKQEKQQKQRQIQDIVKNRKEEQVFIPLKREVEEQEEAQEAVPHEYLRQEDQQVMINSLIKAFKGVPASLRQQNVQTEDIHEQQSEQQGSLEEISYSRPKMMVKVLQLQNKLHWEGQAAPDYKYCWTCLQKLKEQQVVSYRSRSFCSESCLETYKGSSQIAQDDPFYSQIQSVQQRFADYLNRKHFPQKQLKKKEHFQQFQEEQIDFDIL